MGAIQTLAKAIQANTLAPCRVATTANTTLVGLQTVDGVAVIANDRVAVVNQSDTTENGVYTASTGTWSRAPDFNGVGDILTGAVVAIAEGTASQQSLFQISFSGEFNPGSSALIFVRIYTESTHSEWLSILSEPPVNEDSYIIVNDLTEFQNLSGYVENDVVQLLGRTNEGDGAGGRFVFIVGDQSSSVADDEVTTGEGDGGIWIAPGVNTNGVTIAKDGLSGAWKRDFSGEVSDAWYGTDNALSLAAAVSGASGGRLLITRDWSLTAGVTLSDNTTVVGAGGSITLNGADLRAFTLGNNCYIENLGFTGANNSATSAGDTAIYASEKSGVKVEDCYFTNFEGSPVYLANCTEIDVNDNEFENNIGSGDVTDGTTDIYIADSAARVSACNNIHKADATTPKNIAIFMTSFDSDGEVVATTVNDNVIDGYARGGVFLADEAPLTTFGTGDATVSDNIILNSGQQAIKIKNVGRTVVSGNVIDEFEVTGPELAGSRLQGAIFLNAGGNITCSNNTIFTSSANATNGIVFAGLPSSGDYGTNPGPRSVFSLAANTVVGAPDHAVYVGQRVYDVEITGLVARDCGGWVWMDGGTSDATNDPAQNISVTGGSYRSRGSGGDNSALQIDDCKKVNVSNALLDEAGGFGIQVTGSTDVSLVGIDVLDAGQGGTNTSGLRIDGVTRLRARNLTLANADGTTMTHGVSFNGSNSGLVIQACEIGGQTAAVTGTIAADTVLRDNKGFNGYEVALDASASATVAVYDGVRDYNLTGGTNVTDITGGSEGDIIWIRRGSADPTLVHNVSKIATADGSNITLTAAGSAGPSIVGLRKRGSVWFEIARSG